MAEFYQVHRDRLDKAMAKFASRKGEYFCIPLLEPVKPAVTSGPLFDPACRRTETARFLRTDAAGACRPAFADDVDTVEKWQERHRETPAETFRAPDPWGDRFGPPEDME